MKVYFPDTNLFFECRKASDLPWGELPGVGEDEEIRLIIPDIVVTEIERHKSKGNSRTAKRAREASALLRKALESPDHRTEIGSANRRITLELPSPIKVDFSPFPNLDPAKADHQIAAEYAARLKDEPNLIALSDDTLLVVAMRSLGFNPVLVPNNWKLAPEKDERDDKIDKLEVELKTLRQTSPEILVAFSNVNGTTVETLPVEIDKFELSKDDFDRAAVAYLLQFREETNFQLEPPRGSPPPLASLLQLGTWRAPTGQEIATYRSDYRRWESSVRDALPNIAAVLNGIAREAPFKVVIANNGYVNASEVRLTLTGFDGVNLLDSIDEEDEKERTKKLLLPSPPKAPRGRYVDPLSGFGGMEGLDISAAVRRYSGLTDWDRPRDPNGFYYVGARGQRPITELELECKAFPHQVEPHTLNFRAFIREDRLGGQPRLRVRVQASNLKKPLERYLPVSVNMKATDFAWKLAEVQQ